MGTTKSWGGRSGSVLWAVLLLLAAPSGVAQDRAEEPLDSGVEERVEVSLVLVDFLLLDDRERTVPDLRIEEIKLTVGGRETGLRVSTLPTRFGEKCVIRILGSGSKPLDVDQLGFDDDSQTLLVEAVDLPQGLILITGPTGSGKSSTWAGTLKPVQSWPYSTGQPNSSVANAA